MLRALGFRLTDLVQVVLFKSLVFSFPGFVLGIVIAAIINVLLREIIYIGSHNNLDYGLTPLSIVFGVCFGLFMPLIANFVPIKQSMQKNLRSALDLNRNKDESVGIKIEKLEEIGISAN